MKCPDKIDEYLKETGDACSCTEFVSSLRKKAESMRDKETFREQLAHYKVLSSEVRLLIFKLLEQKPLCTCALAEILEMSEGNVSHHLKKLEREGLVVGKKTGRFTTYYTKEQLIDLLSG